MEARILSHVEKTEFLKEVARREVERLLARADVKDLIDQPQQFIEELLSAILIALGTRAQEMASESRDYAKTLGLAAIETVELEELKEASDDDFLLIAFPLLAGAAGPIRRRIEEMIDARLSSETIASALSSEVTREALFASFTSAVRTSAATYIQELDRAILTAAADGAEEETFGWVAVMDDATCDDDFDNSCAPRHNEVMTLPEWDDVGRPGAPNLLCSLFAKSGSYCRCTLAAVSVGVNLLNPVRVTDAIKAGKERAAALFV